MVVKTVVCPQCNEPDNTYKVSDIYIQSLVRLKNGNSADAPIIDKLQAIIPEERRSKLKGARYYRQLMESFAPPQGETHIIRSVNPDWIAFATGLLSLYILYQIYTSQHGAFWVSLAVAGIALAAYFFFRKQIFAKYETQRVENEGNAGIVEKAVGEWMKLYYCAADNVVFNEKNKLPIRIEEMRTYLITNARAK